jgi:hypothetical protein
MAREPHLMTSRTLTSRQRGRNLRRTAAIGMEAFDDVENAHA